MVVVLGQGATVVPGSSLAVSPLFLLAAGDKSAPSSATAVVSKPEDGLVPLVQIQGPTQLSACSTHLQLDATRTSKLGGRPATSIVWALDYLNQQPTKSELAVEAALAAFSGLNADIDASLFSYNTEYTITVEVTNFLGETSIGYHSVVRSATRTPLVSILSPNVFYVAYNQAFTLESK